MKVAPIVIVCPRASVWPTAANRDAQPANMKVDWARKTEKSDIHQKWWPNWARIAVYLFT